MAYAPINANNSLASSVDVINGALDLILGLSHSTTAPSSPEAWQPWLDSTSSAATLKIRDGANGSWIPIHHLETQSGPVASDGTNNVKILAPSSLTAGYTVTLPDSAELPSSGLRYVLVDSNGTLSFSASTP